MPFGYRSHSHPIRMTPTPTNGLGPGAGIISIGSPVTATGEVINIYQAENILVFNTPGEIMIRDDHNGQGTETGYQEGPNRMRPQSPAINGFRPGSPTTPTRRAPGPLFGITASSQTSSPASVTINGTIGAIIPATPPRRSITEGPSSSFSRSQLTPMASTPVASSSQDHAPNGSPFCSCVECRRARFPPSPASWSSSSSSTMSPLPSDHDRYVSPYCTHQ